MLHFQLELTVSFWCKLLTAHKIYIKIYLKYIQSNLQKDAGDNMSI